jgi:hypothetical protein
MTDITKETLATEYAVLTGNREIVMQGTNCGCFYCRKTFSPLVIEEWIHEELTPLCPFCGIDSVLGELQGYPLTDEFLTSMHNHYFTRTR